jgi:hypothetical protein
MRAGFADAEGRMSIASYGRDGTGFMKYCLEEIKLAVYVVNLHILQPRFPIPKDVGFRSVRSGVKERTGTQTISMVDLVRSSG